MKARGIIAAAVTPFDQHGTLAEDVMKQLVDHLINGKVHGLLVAGSQGEFFSLDPDEKARLIEVVVERTAGRIPVYAGIGAIATREAERQAKEAEKIGADAITVLTPFFIRPTQDELFQHYVSIAESTSLPVLLYNNPERTGVNLETQLVARLSEIDNIVGVKDSSGDLTLTTELIRQTSEEFAVLAGKDTLIYPTLACGGKGAVAATANVVPKLVVEIYESFVNGDHRNALKAQDCLSPVRMAFQLGSFPVVIKEALTMIGIDAGPARAPISSMQPEKRRELRQILREVLESNVSLQ